MKKLYSPLFLMIPLVFALEKADAQVCTFPGAECCGEGITNFQLNGTPAINRTSTVSENGGFTNTGLTSTVTKGQTYNFSITFPLEANIVNCNTYNLKIYIDYNQNNLLTDVGEEVVFLANVVTGTHTGSFTIPTTALTGNAYMRVMMKMAAVSLSGGYCGHSGLTPCNSPADPVGFHGEVENYTLNIQPSTGINEYINDIIAMTVSPNPATDKTAINFSLKKANNVVVEIYNITGEKIATVSEGQQGIGEHVIFFNPAELNLESGIYFVKLTTGNAAVTKRLAVLK